MKGKTLIIVSVLVLALIIGSQLRANAEKQAILNNDYGFSTKAGDAARIAAATAAQATAAETFAKASAAFGP